MLGAQRIKPRASADGWVIAGGMPERVEKSYTGQYLRPILVGHEALQPSEVIEALAKKG